MSFPLGIALSFGSTPGNCQNICTLADNKFIKFMTIRSAGCSHPFQKNSQFSIFQFFCSWPLKKQEPWNQNLPNILNSHRNKHLFIPHSKFLKGTTCSWREFPNHGSWWLMEVRSCDEAGLPPSDQSQTIPGSPQHLNDPDTNKHTDEQKMFLISTHGWGFKTRLRRRQTEKKIWRKFKPAASRGSTEGIPSVCRLNEIYLHEITQTHCQPDFWRCGDILHHVCMETYLFL